MSEDAFTGLVQIARQFISGRLMGVTERLDGGDAFVTVWLLGT